MKQTQYQLILNALRKAGNKGCTVRDLLQFSNAPWKRISEMEILGYVMAKYHGPATFMERIERQDRLHNGRTIRVYVLKRVK